MGTPCGFSLLVFIDIAGWYVSMNSSDDAKITRKIRSWSRVCAVWLFQCAFITAICGFVASAQTVNRSEDSEIARLGFISGTPALVADQTQDAKTEQQDQSQTSNQTSKPGVVIGTVLDQSGAVSVGTTVRFTPDENKSLYREAVSGNNGQFTFANVPPGHFQLSVSSIGFGNEVFSGDLAPGQTYLVPPIVLSVATVVTNVKVTVDPVQVATEQVKEQEHQRVLSFIPNFYVTYHEDAAPLTTKLKYQLAWKSSTDPVTIVGTAFLAGLQQAGDQYGQFGQGAEGYGKRFGAAYADVVASTFLSGAVFPSLFKQDPRYFYKGTGSTRSRILRAVGNSVWCKGDNGRWQVNYSNIAGVVGGAAITSSYYPNDNSQASVILTNSLVRLGQSSLAGIFQEFIAKKLTKPRKSAVDASNE